MTANTPSGGPLEYLSLQTFCQLGDPLEIKETNDKKLLSIVPSRIKPSPRLASLKQGDVTEFTSEDIVNFFRLLVYHHNASIDRPSNHLVEAVAPQFETNAALRNARKNWLIKLLNGFVSLFHPTVHLFHVR